MKYRAVTTCNAEGWEKTGRRMAESFVRHWQGVELTVYAEGFEPDVEGVRVARLPAWLDAFKARHRDNADAHGMATGTYNYRRDCVRFAHKVAAITEASWATIGAQLIWLDADTLTFAEVTTDWLDSLWDGTGYVAWLARADTYPECGFLIFRSGHFAHWNVMIDLRHAYRSGSVLRLAETHDSYVIQKVIEDHGLAAFDLSGPKSRRGHPWLGSRLAEKMDHLKGARKELGRSPKHERPVRDGVKYWA